MNSKKSNNSKNKNELSIYLDPKFVPAKLKKFCNFDSWLIFQVVQKGVLAILENMFEYFYITCAWTDK